MFSALKEILHPKIGRYRPLNDAMKIYEYSRSMSFLVRKAEVIFIQILILFSHLHWNGL